MLNFLNSFGNVIKSFIDFIIHSISTVLNFLAAIPRFTVYVVHLVNTLVPDILKPFILLTITISIILLIWGRNS